MAHLLSLFNFLDKLGPFGISKTALDTLKVLTAW